MNARYMVLPGTPSGQYPTTHRTNKTKTYLQLNSVIIYVHFVNLIVLGHSEAILITDELIYDHLLLSNKP